ncbi:MAG: hypothetical protein HYV16_09115 [Gammaproteobacteria bacterium]|nr:hypothetical protein [Gammaproteobacteria bacterium]
MNPHTVALLSILATQVLTTTPVQAIGTAFQPIEIKQAESGQLQFSPLLDRLHRDDGWYFPGARGNFQPPLVR